MYQGWKILVAWKDVSKKWIPLKDMKESNHVEVAEFAEAKGVDDDPLFAWWLACTLRKQDVVISSIKSIVINK